MAPSRVAVVVGGDRATLGAGPTRLDDLGLQRDSAIEPTDLRQRHRQGLANRGRGVTASELLGQCRRPRAVAQRAVGTRREQPGQQVAERGRSSQHPRSALEPRARLHPFAGEQERRGFADAGGLAAAVERHRLAVVPRGILVAPQLGFQCRQLEARRHRGRIEARRRRQRVQRGLIFASRREQSSDPGLRASRPECRWRRSRPPRGTAPAPGRPAPAARAQQRPGARCAPAPARSHPDARATPTPRGRAPGTRAHRRVPAAPRRSRALGPAPRHSGRARRKTSRWRPSRLPRRTAASARSGATASACSKARAASSRRPCSNSNAPTTSSTRDRANGSSVGSPAGRCSIAARR